MIIVVVQRVPFAATAGNQLILIGGSTSIGIQGNQQGCCLSGPYCTTIGLWLQLLAVRPSPEEPHLSVSKWPVAFVFLLFFVFHFKVFSFYHHRCCCCIECHRIVVTRGAMIGWVKSHAMATLQRIKNTKRKMLKVFSLSDNIHSTKRHTKVPAATVKLFGYTKSKQQQQQREATS